MSYDAWIEAEATSNSSQHNIFLLRSNLKPEQLMFGGTQEYIPIDPLPGLAQQIDVYERRLEVKGLMNFFGRTPLPRLDAYDEFAVFGKAVQMIAPDLRNDLVSKIGTRVVGPALRADILSIEAEISKLCKLTQGFIVGGQRQFCAEAVENPSDFYRGCAVRLAFNQ